MTPEAQAYKRIFTLLFMLRYEFEWICEGAKPDKSKRGTSEYYQKKRYYDAVKGNYDTVFGMIKALLKATNKSTAEIIEMEMTSERIKDLHVGLDTLLEIDNIEEVMTVIKNSMVPHE